MSRKRQRAKRKRTTPASIKESRTAEVTTVAWMLSSLTALMCLVASLLVLLFTDTAADEIEHVLLGQLFGRLMMFAALITSMIGLILLPITIRIRRSPPPRAIILSCLGICTLPLIVLAFWAVS